MPANPIQGGPPPLPTPRDKKVKKEAEKEEKKPTQAKKKASYRGHNVTPGRGRLPSQTQQKARKAAKRSLSPPPETKRIRVRATRGDQLPREALISKEKASSQFSNDHKTTPQRKSSQAMRSSTNKYKRELGLELEDLYQFLMNKPKSTLKFKDFKYGVKLLKALRSLGEKKVTFQKSQLLRETSKSRFFSPDKIKEIKINEFFELLCVKSKPENYGKIGKELKAYVSNSLLQPFKETRKSSFVKYGTHSRLSRAFENVRNPKELKTLFKMAHVHQKMHNRLLPLLLSKNIENQDKIVIEHEYNEITDQESRTSGEEIFFTKGLEKKLSAMLSKYENRLANYEKGYRQGRNMKF